MADSVVGAIGPIVLDGHVMNKLVDVTRDISFIRTKSLTVMADGGTREAYGYQGAGYPIIGRKYKVTLKYERTRGQQDLLEEILEYPGPHDVVVWQRIHRTWAGDGSRVEFSLKRAPYVVDGDLFGGFPGTFPQAWKDALSVEAAIHLGDERDPFTVVQKTQVEYDGGDPSADEAWFVPEGFQFKVGTAPEAGETLYVRLVPILKMFEEVEVSKQYTAGRRTDPRDLVFREQ